MISECFALAPPLTFKLYLLKAIATNPEIDRFRVDRLPRSLAGVLELGREIYEAIAENV